MNDNGEGRKDDATIVSVQDVRRQWSDVFNRVAYRGERIVVTRHGKPVVALIPVDDAA